MHRLLVLYFKPSDPGHFKRYYEEKHLKLVAQLPGMRAGRHSFDVKLLTGAEAPFFCIFEADFDSEAAMLSAMQSDIGKALSADVPNYAPAGGQVMHYPVYSSIVSGPSGEL